MEKWFSINKIDERTYAISEEKHWEKPNCFLLIGNKKAALIDTGLGIGNIREIVDLITDLDITVLTTHVHWDHIGGHRYFEDFGVHKLEETWINGGFPLALDVVKINLGKENSLFPTEFKMDDYTIFQGKPRYTYEDGYVIDLGNRNIRVIHTPGHSPGHCCFYDEEKQYLYTGDLIYRGKLDAYYPSTNAIDFYKSVKKIKALDVERILPGHFDVSLDSGILDEIYYAFSKLNNEGILSSSHGIFEFNQFKIHI